LRRKNRHVKCSFLIVTESMKVTLEGTLTLVRLE
jgi:hypothetical protein